MEDILKKIKASPYEYIRNHYEKVYKHMGYEVFSVVSLVIPSLILPPIPHEQAREIKPSINYLLIATPGCIDGETYICLSDGTFKKIKHFGKNHLDKLETFIRVNPIKSDCNYTDKAVTFHKYENQKCFKITLNSGREIIVSELHPLFTKKGWIKAKDLKVGDKIKVAHHLKCTKTRYEKLSLPKLRNQSKKINLPLLNEDVGLIFGYALGDGSSRKYSVTFYINEEENDLVDILKDKIKEQFGVKIVEYKKVPNNEKVFIDGREIHRKQVITNLEVNSIAFSYLFDFVKEKKVPESIMASKKSVASNFLKGLFEADGCCRLNKNSNGRFRGEICLKSVNKKILLDVQLLLLKFGIKAGVYGDNLNISKTDDLNKFSKEIGFLSEKKKNKLSKILLSIKLLRKRHLDRKYSERIKSIEDLPNQTVYDIEVERTHKYIANGIISHNSGKSSIAETFSKLAYNSFSAESITDAKFYEVMSERDYVSIVISDVFKIFSDKILSKTMENVLGDEQKISRMTKRTDSTEKKIRAVSFLSGTPNSLTSVISDGLIFRTHCQILIHNQQEHEEIGEFVSNGAFKQPKDTDEEKAIMEFYQELLMIQNNRHRTIDRITGYIVKDEYKKRILEVWKPLVTPMTRRTKFSFFREFHSALRFLVAHAFLNVFNRKVEDGKIVIQEEDVDVAINLMTKELETKFEILMCSRVVNEEKMKTTKDLSEYVERLKKNKMSIKDSSRNIMGSLIGK